MMGLLHWLIICLLAAAPGAGFLYVVVRKRREVFGPLFVPVVGGTLTSFTLNIVHARLAGGTILPLEVIVCAYWACAVLLVLRAFDMALMRVALRLVSVPFHRPRPEAFLQGLRRSLANAGRVVVLFATVIPVVIVTSLCYRPAVRPGHDLSFDLSRPVERVTFDATDGSRVEAFWIEIAGTARTVVVCSGNTAHDPALVPLLSELARGGYNVLAVNLRAQGGSAGHLTSFGRSERYDVLGAVRYLRERHPKESERIDGVGSGIGAVALLGASVDDSDDGRAIESVVLIGAFDDLPAFALSLASRHFPSPFNRAVTNIGLSAGSALVGENLFDVKPVDTIDAVSPRPVLFVSDQADLVVPVSQGRNLYEAASQPKYFYWLPERDDNAARFPGVVAKVIRAFFDVARPII